MSSLPCQTRGQWLRNLFPFRRCSGNASPPRVPPNRHAGVTCLTKPTPARGATPGTRGGDKTASGPRARGWFSCSATLAPPRGQSVCLGDSPGSMGTLTLRCTCTGSWNGCREAAVVDLLASTCIGSLWVQLRIGATTPGEQVIGTGQVQVRSVEQTAGCSEMGVSFIGGRSNSSVEWTEIESAWHSWSFGKSIGKSWKEVSCSFSCQLPNLVYSKRRIDGCVHWFSFGGVPWLKRVIWVMNARWWMLLERYCSYVTLH